MAIQYLNYLLEQTGAEYEVVGQATNSVRALEEIKERKPDLIFADINMPVIDGLELSRRILESISAKIFLLTSYRDFDFVKKGMQIGVTEYLLKNELTEDVLKKLLQKTAEELATEKQQQHLVLEHNVRQFLQSTTKESKDHIYEHKLMQRYALIGIFPRKLFFIRHRMEETFGASLNCYEMEQLEFPKGLTCSALVPMGDDTLYGVFFIQGDAADGQVLLQEAARTILRYLKGRQIKASCLISETKYHFFDLQECYQEMKLLGNYIYAYPGQEILSAAKLREKKREKVVTEYWINQIDICVANQDPDGSWANLQELFKRSRENLDFWEYTENIQSVYQYLKNYVEKKHLRREILDIPMQYDSAEELEKYLSECLGLVFSDAGQEETTGYSAYVQTAIAFIRHHYSRDISVPEIAEAAGISEGHLRRLFRQELNRKVVDYLTDYRLECAKLLMRQGERNLTEIWQRTGFTSAQYFSYVFKHKEGILPREYIKQLRSQ